MLRCRSNTGNVLLDNVETLVYIKRNYFVILILLALERYINMHFLYILKNKFLWK